MLLNCGASPSTESEAFKTATVPELPHQRQLSRLAFLAPDLQRQILDGVQPTSLTLRMLLKADLPLAWADQRARFERMRGGRPDSPLAQRPGNSKSGPSRRGACALDLVTQLAAAAAARGDPG